MHTSTRNSNTLDVLCAGEALIDLIADASGKLTPCRGGSVYNLARTLALQGIPTGYLNPLSADLFGQGFRQELQASQVTMMEEMPIIEPTSLAVVHLDSAAKATYTFYREGVADRQINAVRLNELSASTWAQVVCTGCLALSADDATHYLPWLAEQKRLGKLIVIDINVRAALMKNEDAYKNNIYAALAYANIIKASDDDLDFFQISAEQLLAQTSAQLVLLTLGSQGAQILMPHDTVLTAPAPQGLRVVDTVGAGDCFLGGFLAYLIRETRFSHLSLTDQLDAKHTPFLQAALEHAIYSASINITKEGCQPPSWFEVITFSKTIITSARS